MRKQRKIISNANKELAVKRYMEGLSIAKVGKLFDVDCGVIRRAILKRGLTLRTRTDCHLKLTKKQDKQIYKLYNKGYTPDEIGKKFDITDNTVRYSVKRQGGTLRSLSQSLRKYTFDHNFFEIIDTEAKAYFLGFYLADGNVWQNKVQLSIHPQDSYIINSFIKYINGNNKVHFYTKQNLNVAKLVLNSSKMVNDLISHGIIYRKTYKLIKVPLVPDSLEKHFWRGVLDGDGWVMITNKGTSIETGICNMQKIVIEHFKRFLEKNNITPGKICHANQKIYKIGLSAVNAIRFLDLIYNESSLDLRLTRKYKKYVKGKKYRIKHNLPI